MEGRQDGDLLPQLLQPLGVQHEVTGELGHPLLDGDDPAEPRVDVV